VDVTRSQLARLTAGKAVVTTAVRWLPFFLPTLAIAFATTTPTLTTIIGIGEMAGLATIFIGRQLDDGEERRFLVRSLALVAVASLLAIIGNLWLFALSYLLMVIAGAGYTVSGHTFLSRRVPFEGRARVIGIFETAWAFALLVGAPIVALLITQFGWRAPFIVVSAVAVVIAGVVWRGIDDSQPTGASTIKATRQRLNAESWIAICASAAIAVSGLTTIVIAGTWLDEALGVSTGGIGAVAMAFGAAELIASSSSAVVADRAGPNRSTRAAMFATLIGLAIMTQAGSSLAIGALGLLFFFLGFEYSIVTSFSIVSDAMPAAPGRALAMNNAFGTVMRGLGVIASGLLYEEFGIRGPAIVSACAGVIAIALLTVAAQRSRSKQDLLA